MPTIPISALCARTQLERVLRHGHVVLDLDAGMQLVEAREQLRQQVEAGRPRGGEGERADTGVAGACERAARVREQRLRPEHVVREQPAVLGQLGAAGGPHDQRMAQLRLELGDLLRDRRLADEELVGGARERGASGDGREGAQPGVQLHALKL